jgi:hypothetical protein
MPAPRHITSTVFTRTFPRLILGRSLLPKKRSELQMLLTSVVFDFEFDRIYSEKQVNELIWDWVSRFGADLGVDHVTLRRYLVDEGLLVRDEFGTTYQLATASPFFSYDLSIRDLDLEALIARANEERAARKRTHLAADGSREEDDA